MIAGYQSLLGPHAVTTRWTYTPPFRFAAFVEVANVFVMRIGVTAVLAISQATLVFLPFYGGTANIVNAMLSNNTTGEFTSVPISSLGYMAYGDTLRFDTQTGDTTGTCIYLGSFKGSEFLY